MEQQHPRNNKLCHHLGPGAALALALLAGAVAGSAQAQQLGDLASKAKLSDAERAKRDADKVYQWIRFHADQAGAKPSKPAAAPAAPAAPATAAAPAPVSPAALAAAKLRAERAEAAARPVADAGAAQAAASPLPPPPVAAAPQPPLLVGAAAAVMPSAAAPAPAPVAATPPQDGEPPLRLIQRVEPEFPRRVLGDSSGLVLVRFTVQPDGSVSQAEALKSSSQRLVQGVLDAVRRWRFAPIAKARTATVEVGFRTE